MRDTLRRLAMVATLFLAACGQPPENRPMASVDEIRALEKAIVALDTSIDPKQQDNTHEGHSNFFFL